MDLLTIIAILQAVAQLLPEIPEVVQGINTAVALLTEGRAPTAEEQASIDALLDKAHATFQAGGGTPATHAP